jgi:predicted dehydrogenase
MGSFVKYGLDVQEDALKAGARPHLDRPDDMAIWGKDPQVGTLTIHRKAWTQTSAAPDVHGNYLAYYAQLRDHLRDHLTGQASAPAVTPEQVLQDMQLLELGQQSALEGRFVPIPGPAPVPL